jgi:peptide/nickel transport system substrate-binding protein
MRRNGENRLVRRTSVVLAVAFFVLVSACTGRDAEVRSSSTTAEVTLRVGFPLGDVENPQAGIQQAAANIALEGLVEFDRDGRPRQALAEKWWMSEDGLTWRVWVQQDAAFHDDQTATASVIRDILAERLPRYLRGPSDDIDSIRAVSDRELEFRLKRRSRFLLEGLEAPIRKPGAAVIGTGAFSVVSNSSSGIEMRANPNYYAGAPLIDKIVFKPYPSVRAAWADLLRGQVDMLWEVGVDALESLQDSSQIRVFTFARPYIYAVVFNTRTQPFQNSALRRKLNSAIDRSALIDGVLSGHGEAADGPVPPNHWARDRSAPKFDYKPEPILDEGRQVRSTCIFGELSLERMALETQRQLQAVGVDVMLESVTGDVLLARLESGDFECALVDIISGPNLLRPYWVWHSNGPHNWGRYKSYGVDAALDSIRHATDDKEYRAGVAAFQRAINEDPPAIFLAWSERARAVSTRFEVPVEPGRDILSTLRLWRPVTDNPN